MRRFCRREFDVRWRVCDFFFFIELHKCVNIRNSFSFYAEYLKICTVKILISNIFHLIVISRLEKSEARCVIIHLLHTVFSFN